jgi:asparagine synthetase B (glutamine-hydrolysing)
MCGFIAWVGESRAPAKATSQPAFDQMNRRGPYVECLWSDAARALGHRRLSIIDLYSRAQQPMRAACGRYVIAFNGEIYNFRELRNQLAADGFRFRTSSDTELILALFPHEEEADATPFAAAAAHYGIRHHVRRIKRQEFEADLPRVWAAMDQPSVDGINTRHASKAAAEPVFVAVVSGAGGDELFHGYNSSRQLPPLVAGWIGASRVPGAMASARGACKLQANRTGNRRRLHFPDWARATAGTWWLHRSVFSPEDLPLLMVVSWPPMRCEVLPQVRGRKP